MNIKPADIDPQSSYVQKVGSGRLEILFFKSLINLAIFQIKDQRISLGREKECFIMAFQEAQT